jgi:hypothetical protein
MRTRAAKMLGVEFPICAFSHCRLLDMVAEFIDAIDRLGEMVDR